MGGKQEEMAEKDVMMEGERGVEGERGSGGCNRLCRTMIVMMTTMIMMMIMRNEERWRDREIKRRQKSGRGKRIEGKRCKHNKKMRVGGYGWHGPAAQLRLALAIGTVQSLRHRVPSTWPTCP
jgi:hypothetical protein